MRFIVLSPDSADSGYQARKEERYFAALELNTIYSRIGSQAYNPIKLLAPGLTPRAVIEKFKKIQMFDVHLPTTDGKQLVLTRYTQPEKEHKMLLNQMKLNLPKRSPPKITSNKEAIVK